MTSGLRHMGLCWPPQVTVLQKTAENVSLALRGKTQSKGCHSPRVTLNGNNSQGSKHGGSQGLMPASARRGQSVTVATVPAGPSRENVCMRTALPVSKPQASP